MLYHDRVLALHQIIIVPGIIQALPVTFQFDHGPISVLFHLRDVSTLLFPDNGFRCIALVSDRFLFQNCRIERIAYNIVMCFITLSNGRGIERGTLETWQSEIRSLCQLYWKTSMIACMRKFVSNIRIFIFLANYAYVYQSKHYLKLINILSMPKVRTKMLFPFF